MNCGLFRSRNSGRLRRVAIARLGAIAVALEKAERDERVEEIGVGPRVQAERLCSSRPVMAPDPSVVNSPSSIAESRTLAGQKAMPTSMMRAGDNVFITGSPSGVFAIEMCLGIHPQSLRRSFFPRRGQW